MAAKKGSWKGGNAPAQGNTPRRVSRPVEGVKKFTGAMKKSSTRTSSKNSKSPSDGRKRGKK